MLHPPNALPPLENIQNYQEIIQKETNHNKKKLNKTKKKEKRGVQRSE